MTQTDFTIVISIESSKSDRDKTSGQNLLSQIMQSEMTEWTSFGIYEAWGLNHLILRYQKLLISFNLQKRSGYIKLHFSFILCKTDFKDYFDKCPKQIDSISFKPFHDLQNRRGMDVVIVDFSKENPYYNPPIASNEQEITDFAQILSMFQQGVAIYCRLQHP